MNYRFHPRALLTALVITAVTSGNGFASILSKNPLPRVMCVGDSITEGKFANSGGYRKVLQTLLRDNGYNILYVGKEDNGAPENRTGFSNGMENPNHEGYGSFRIDEILNGGTREGHTAPPFSKTLEAFHPDVILMMLGTNDVLGNYELATIADRLDQLVETVFAANPKTTLILAKPTPLTGDRETKLNAYCAQITDLVAKKQAQGRNIVIADMHSALDLADLPDKVHPNLLGFQKMAAVWYEALTGEKAPALPAPVAAAPSPVAATPSPVAAAATSASVAAAPIQGGMGAFSFTGGVAENNPRSFVLGFQFTTGDKPLTVGALGYLNDGQTGSNATHEVGIFENSTKQLITPAVPVTTSGGALSAQGATFTYVKLNKPVVLAAHTAYTIGARTTGCGYVKQETGASMKGCDLSSLHAAYIENASSLVFPDKIYTPNDPALIGPNFRLIE